MALKRYQPSNLGARLDAASLPPLVIAPRSPRCDNHVCREIRAAYHASHEYRLRHLGEVERQAGED